MKQIYKFDDNGIYMDTFLFDEENGVYYDGIEWSIPTFEYTELVPQYAKKVKWDGGVWNVIEEYPVEIEPIMPKTQLQILQEENEELKRRQQATQEAVDYILMSMEGGI